MNISNFKENLNYISYCGISLSLQEAALIENSLIILKSDNKFKEIYFWGRINGVKNDYYIAFGYHKNCISGSKFFYSVNCKDGEWILLPEVVPENDRLCLLNQNLFQGDVSVIEDVVMVIFVVLTLNTVTSFITDLDPKLCGRRSQRDFQTERGRPISLYYSYDLFRMCRCTKRSGDSSSRRIDYI